MTQVLSTLVFLFAMGPQDQTAAQVSANIEVLPGSGNYRAAIIVVTLKNTGKSSVQVANHAGPGRGLWFNFADLRAKVDLAIPFRGDVPDFTDGSYIALDPNEDCTISVRWCSVFHDIPNELQGSLSGRVSMTYDIKGYALPTDKALPLCTGPIDSNILNVKISRNRVGLVSDRLELGRVQPSPFQRSHRPSRFSGRYSAMGYAEFGLYELLREV